MKAIVVMIALLVAPAAAVVGHGHLSEPATLIMSGASLLGMASLIRRRSAAQV
jgi:hypothetical protein